MKSSKFGLCLAALSLVVTLFASTAHADTYEVFSLGIDDMQFYGMSSTDLVVLTTGTDPACGFGTCYTTYINGIDISTSSTAPTFTADNGTACTPSLPSGWYVFSSVCNNGRIAWTGAFDAFPPFQVYTGPTADPFSTVITGTFFSGNDGDGAVYMNSQGDIVFDDTFYDEWYEAVDLSTAPTPEPNTLLLLATGILALAAVTTLRRRPLPN
jgi:hypothetical protein